MYKQSIVIPWFLKIRCQKLTSLRVIQSATWLTASWFVGELSCKPTHYLRQNVLQNIVSDREFKSREVIIIIIIIIFIFFCLVPSVVKIPRVKS